MQIQSLKQPIARSDMQLSPVEYEKRYFQSLESVWGSGGDAVFRFLAVGQKLIQQLVSDGMLRLAHGVSGSERQCRS
ncbi:hypothetical protein OML25_01150 [Stutzerimonas stutzeri]|nr:hypothetical protein OML25_01150 [Stutzerimonas stutzeri]